MRRMGGRRWLFGGEGGGGVDEGDGLVGWVIEGWAGGGRGGMGWAIVISLSYVCRCLV